MSDITLKEIAEIHRKADAYDKFKEWLEDQMTPKTDAWGDTGYSYMIRCAYIMEKLNEFLGDDDV